MYRLVHLFIHLSFLFCCNQLFMFGVCVCATICLFRSHFIERLGTAMCIEPLKKRQNIDLVGQFQKMCESMAITRWHVATQIGKCRKIALNSQCRNPPKRHKHILSCQCVTKTSLFWRCQNCKKMDQMHRRFDEFLTKNIVLFTIVNLLSNIHLTLDVYASFKLVFMRFGQ